MIQIGEQTYSLGGPWIIGGLTALALFACLFVLVILALRSARRTARSTEPLAQYLGQLADTVTNLDRGQLELAGRLTAASETQAATQARVIETVERRLEEVQRAMGDSLSGTATRTARSLGELQQRLETIDKAQTNIEKLSGDVLTLQDILANKQTRGAFGEIQLNDIVSKALPPDAYTFQAKLSNDKRADCLIHLPNPPGPIVIDAKFPLEAYEQLRAAKSDRAILEATRAVRAAVRKHIKDISERYVLNGETADGALMFLPSEAVYAELHASFPEVVREGFDARVWIVSPTTCMATLNTMRAILKDARMREQAGAIRRELSMLAKDMDRLGDRVGKLDTHFTQAARDIESIKISATKAGTRARRLDGFEFDHPEPDAATAPETLTGISAE